MEEENTALAGSALDLLAKEDLTLQGVEELALRIDLLTREIARAQAMLDSKKGSRSEAEALFSK